MIYEFTINNQTVRGELDANSVARFAAAGIPLAVVRRRHYRRGTEQHVGEYTDAEHEGMLALGWDLVKVLADGEDVAPSPAPVVTEAQRLAAEHPELPGIVRSAIGALTRLVQMGVQIDLSAGLPPWRALGPAIAARRKEIDDILVYRELDAAADEADGYWRDVEYFCGSPQAAYGLAAELAEIGV